VTHRRRYRRNPGGGGLSIRGVVGTVWQGAMGAAVVTGGKMLGNVVANRLPVMLSTTTHDAAGNPVKVETQNGVLARRVVAAGLIGVGFSLIFRGASRQLVDQLVIGAMQSPVEQFVRPLLPTTGPFANALGAYPMVPRIGSYPMRAYPEPRQLTRGGFRGYPRGTRPIGCAVEGEDEG
jgi:hypothetical protein